MKGVHAMAEAEINYCSKKTQSEEAGQQVEKLKKLYGVSVASSHQFHSALVIFNRNSLADEANLPPKPPAGRGPFSEDSKPCRDRFERGPSPMPMRGRPPQQKTDERPSSKNYVVSSGDKPNVVQCNSVPELHPLKPHCPSPPVRPLSAWHGFGASQHFTREASTNGRPQSVDRRSPRGRALGGLPAQGSSKTHTEDCNTARGRRTPSEDCNAAPGPSSSAAHPARCSSPGSRPIEEGKALGPPTGPILVTGQPGGMPSTQPGECMIKDAPPQRRIGWAPRPSVLGGA